MFEDDRWLTVTELRTFTNDSNRMMTSSELDALIELLALKPLVGEEIPDSGGLRFLRWPAESQGKNGHVRVVYYFRDLSTPIFLLALFERGERLNLSSDEKSIARDLVDELAAPYASPRSKRILTSDGAA